MAVFRSGRLRDSGHRVNRAHLGHCGLDSRVDHVEHRLGVNAEGDDQDDERHDREQLRIRRSGIVATDSTVGPVIIRWYIHRM